ncbi:MAG: hydrogenase expression/formation protein HypE, partial [Armatimonadota bacterium]
NDAAILQAQPSALAFTTDSFVVTPHVFPGGDIGKLAVCGTVNDLAMVGARPVALSVGFIIEEGLDVGELERIVASAAQWAERSGVRIVTGDTKVVERGAADKVFINASGVGLVECAEPPSAEMARPGDRVILSGTVADHGIAILMARDQFAFEGDIRSDCAPLWPLVEEMLEAGVQPRVLRDPTRGGLATVLNEVAAASEVGIVIEESAIPLAEPVRGACDMLGLDPLYVANEGKLVAVVPPSQADACLDALHRLAQGSEAALIGEVTGASPPGRVTLRTAAGGSRVLDLLAGEQLPRIC